MIKHVIFDIGNVLMSFDPYSYYVKQYQDEKKTKQLCKIFEHVAWAKYDQGLYMIEDLKELYHKEYPMYQQEIDEILGKWMEMMQPMYESFEWMKEFKDAGYQVMILSNISSDSAEYLKSTQPFFDYCQDAVLSYEEKLIKPDPKLFEILLTRYGLEAKECLFLDDKANNIATANQLGIHGIVFTSIEDAKKQVEVLIKQENGCAVC